MDKPDKDTTLRSNHQLNWTDLLEIIIFQIPLLLFLRVIEPVFPLGETLIPYLLITIYCAYQYGPILGVFAFFVCLFSIELLFNGLNPNKWQHSISIQYWMRYIVFPITAFIGGYFAVSARNSVRKMRDLTHELQDAQACILTQAQILQTVFSKIPIGLALLDPQLRVTRVNEQAAKVARREIDSLIGVSLETILLEEFGPQIKQDVINHCHELLRTKEPFSVTEWPVQYLDEPDETRYLNWRITPITRSGNELIAILLTTREVTSVINARTALQESEQKYRLLFESMSEVVSIDEMIYDDHGNPVDWVILNANDAYQSVIGIPLDQVIGHRFSEIFGQMPDKYPYLKMYADMLQSGKPIQFETYFDAIHKYLHFSAFPLSSTRFATIAMDITERKRIELERAERLHGMDTLIQVSTRVLAETTIHGIMSRIIEAGCKLVGARLGMVARLLPDGTLKLDATSNLCYLPDLSSNIVAVGSGGGIYNVILNRDTPIRLSHEELINHPAWEDLPANHAPIRGLLGVRLVGKEGKPFGLILLSDKQQGEFNIEDEALISQLALITSLGIRQIEARSDAERRAEEAEEGRRILNALMEYVPQGIVIADAPDSRIRMISQYGLFDLKRDQSEVMGVPFTSIIREWDIYHPEHDTQLDTDHLSLMQAIQEGKISQQEEIRYRKNENDDFSILLTNAGPIRDQSGQIIGGISSWMDITPIKAIQKQLEEAYQREHHIAKVLQRALRPNEPALGGGYSIASMYTPAVIDREIGGDFFDVFQLPYDRIGILIGDVSGKGIQAAAFATATRCITRAFMSEGSTPSETLRRVNRVLNDYRPDAESFVTIFLMVLDQPSGELHYSSAGHPPMALRRLNGAIEWIACENPAIGILRDYHFTDSTCFLNPGEKVVLYTDGVSEARSNRGLFGNERIHDVLAQSGHTTAQMVIDHLSNAIQDWTDQQISDDAAVLVISRDEPWKRDNSNQPLSEMAPDTLVKALFFQ